MFQSQKTIAKSIKFSGIGLHSGKVSTIQLIPGNIDTGIKFVVNKKSIEATWTNVEVSQLCTKLKIKKYFIHTIEHLMSALSGLGITNLIIKTNISELPILDGSAKIFYDEILNAGIKEQKKHAKIIKIRKKVFFGDKDKFISIEPSNYNKLSINYTIDFKDSFVKKQTLLYVHSLKNYKKIYDARTFCFQRDLEKIFAMGLARGGSLDNAIVISDNKVLNQDGLRYPDEFVRHKVLDCIGDIYLAGCTIYGNIISYSGGHELNYMLLKKIFEKKTNFEYII